MAYRKEYEESEAVKQARELANKTAAQKPGNYTSQWQQPMQQTAQQIANRKEFEYNLGTDPLYNQYRQQYMRQGKMAMADTVGQAAAMNGGYGSSYGQTAGQQVYNAHVQQLNDRIPELYGMALQKWQAEGAEMMDRLNVLGQMEQQEYGRYRDQLGDWEKERAYANSRLDTERQYDRDVFENERNFGYNAEQDAKNEAWRQQQFEYQKQQDILNREWQQQQFEYEKQQNEYRQQKEQHDTYMNFAQQEVEYLLEHGEEIPEWLLRQSEYDPAYIAAAQRAYAGQNAGGWGGGSGGSASTGSGKGTSGANKTDRIRGAATGDPNGSRKAAASDIINAYTGSATPEQIEEFKRRTNLWGK